MGTDSHHCVGEVWMSVEMIRAQLCSTNPATVLRALEMLRALADAETWAVFTRGIRLSAPEGDTQISLSRSAELRCVAKALRPSACVSFCPSLPDGELAALQSSLPALTVVQ